MYEQENYLRYYIMLALSYWRLIVVAVLLAATSALIITASQDHVYQAQSTIAMLRSRTEVELDPRIRTLTDQELSGTSTTAREEGLVALAKSNEVAQLVLDDVAEQMEAENRRLSAIREMVDAGITGDLVNLTVQHPDPEIAALIANRWAQRYEEYVNTIYGDTRDISADNTAAQVETAKQNYEAAQGSLEEFIADDQILTLEREIAVRQALLDGYQQTLIDVRVNPIATDQAILEDYYTELQQIDGWLADARSLLQQVQNESGSTAGNLGNAVAFVLLQGKVSSSERTNIDESGSGVIVDSNNSPMTLQIDMSNALAEGVSPNDVNSLIQALESRREATDERISGLQAAINGSETSDVSRNNTVPDNSQLERQITALEEEITNLQSEVEARTALRQELEQARDRNWETYQVLLGRQAEEEIASGSPAAEVRLADQAVVPTEPVGRGVIRNTLLAATVALMFSIGAILLIDWWTWDQSSAGEQEVKVPSAMQEQESTSDNLEAERAAEGPPGSGRLSKRTT